MSQNTYHPDTVPAKEHKQALAAVEKANKAAARSDAEVRALTGEVQVLTDKYQGLRERHSNLQETVATQNIKLAVAEARAEERAIAAKSVLDAHLTAKDVELARFQANVDSLVSKLDKVKEEAAAAKAAATRLHEAGTAVLQQQHEQRAAAKRSAEATEYNRIAEAAILKNIAGKRSPWGTTARPTDHTGTVKLINNIRGCVESVGGCYLATRDGICTHGEYCKYKHLEPEARKALLEGITGKSYLAAEAMATTAFGTATIPREDMRAVRRAQEEEIRRAKAEAEAEAEAEEPPPTVAPTQTVPPRAEGDAPSSSSSSSPSSSEEGIKEPTETTGGIKEQSERWADSVDPAEEASSSNDSASGSDESITGISEIQNQTSETSFTLVQCQEALEEAQTTLGKGLAKLEGATGADKKKADNMISAARMMIAQMQVRLGLFATPTGFFAMSKEKQEETLVNGGGGDLPTGSC
jgi:hypothetical protein